ncbi:MAG: methyl-accepting chemotaxis protein [Phycisphaerae bacterium]|nr:methyl-accepting chemotaxis protein [Phycisphaerae bacterium]
MRWDSIEEIVHAGYKSFVTAGLDSTSIVFANRKGTVICDWNPSAAPDGKPVHDMQVLLKQNYADAGWAPAKLAMRGESGSGIFTPPGRTGEYHGGYAPQLGVNGFASLGWSGFVFANTDQTMSGITSIQRQVVTSVAVCGGLMFLGALMLASLLVRPITRLTGRLRDIAEGEADLTKRAFDGRSDEIGDLAKWFDAFVARVEGTVAEVRSGASQIDSGASLVSTSTQAVAADATNPAGNLDQIVTQLRELDRNTEQTNDVVRQASALGDQSQAASAKGGEQMQLMDAAMSEILQGSNEVSRIIKVIDEIAFQTNLLALNAAVEAARAGEAGKGFAIVAEEVRSLARRSADAARSTTTMIESSVERAQRGAELATRVVESLTAINGATVQVKDLLIVVAKASDSQTRGISEINRNVEALNEVINRTAGQTEEMAAAAEETASQAASLRELASRYKVSDKLS